MRPGGGVTRCGDGLVNAAAGEVCDDGNTNEHDTCTTRCALPSCDDGITSGDETDVDCGGSCPSPCAPAQACQDSGDCVTMACDEGLCSWATSCAELHTLAPELGDGVYSIDPDGIGPSDPYEVMCDMTMGGGGWSLVLVSSDDGTDTFTWNQRTLFSTNTNVVGSLEATHLDFKSAAYHDLAITDLLFVHQPSGVWAEYDAVGAGIYDLGTHIEEVGAPICDPNLAGNGHALSNGTLMVAGSLCDTDLYFNLGDMDGGTAACEDLDGDWNDSTYGPSWNGSFNNGCSFDDPALMGLGPGNPCGACLPSITNTEYTALGFGQVLGLNTGTPATGQNHISVYVR